MQRDHKLATGHSRQRIGSSGNVSAAQPRRLGIEKLELRSVLAAIAGLSQSIESFHTLETLGKVDADFTAVWNHRQAIEFSSADAQTITPVKLTPANFDFANVGDVTTTPISVQIADADQWTNLRGSVVNSEAMFANQAMFSSFRMPGMIVVIDTSADDPTPADPSDVSPSNDPTDLPANDPVDSVPVKPSPGSGSATTTKDTRRIIWTDGVEIIEPEASSEHHLHVSSGSVRLQSDSSQPISLNRPSLQDEGTVDHVEVSRQRAESEVVSDLLELKAIRDQRSDTPKNHSPQHAAAQQTLRLPDEIVRSANFSGSQLPEVGRPSTEIFPAQDYVVELDEGGLVELVATEAIRQNGPFQSHHSLPDNSIFEAEVGIFQAIDVAASVTGDPSQAILIPAVLIAAFQLFDQRRKHAELNREWNLR